MHIFVDFRGFKMGCKFIIIKLVANDVVSERSHTSQFSVTHVMRGIL